jgi:hypothetical protein
MTDLFADAPSPGAGPMRRHRWLRRQGAVHINLIVGADAVQRLIALGWLDPIARFDRGAVTSAIVRMGTHALGIKPAEN